MHETSSPKSLAQVSAGWDRAYGPLPQRSWAIITVAFVTLWLTVPSVVGLIRPAETIDLAENRKLAVLPVWPNGFEELPVWFERVSDYLRDHVGFRTAATTLNARALYLIGDSSNQDIVFGRNNFLFIKTAEARNDVFEEELGRRLLSPADLAKLEEQWRRNGSDTAARNLPYLITIVPNKGTVYPEKIPPIGRFVSDHRMLQQAHDVAASAGVGFVDLTEVLEAGRKQRLVWYPRDTHWNSYAALLAYNRIAQEITARFGLEVTQIPHDEWSFVRTSRVMDIARLMGLGDAASDTVDVARLKKRPKVLQEEMTPEKGLMYFEMDNPGAPALLATHDSFIWAILPFLQRGFSKIILKRGTPFEIPWDLVQQHDPDIILTLNIENGLLYFQADPHKALD